CFFFSSRRRHTRFSRDWSSDVCSSDLVFSTDRVSFRSDSRAVDIPMGLAVIDVNTRQVVPIDIFPGANNLNPHFSGDGKHIYFLSNGDGYRNLFRYSTETYAVGQLTDYFTGISGITEYSPAMSISRNDDIVYSYFKGNQYSIYK